MLVPYFGNRLENQNEGILKKSPRFFDLGVRLNYNIRINGSAIQIYGGMKNIFNSYQKDFDVGFDRDPGYIYGPGQPRTIYIGLRLGNSI